MNAPPLEDDHVIHDIRVKDIDISDDNVRLSNPRDDLDELAESIKKYGLLQPVVLRDQEDDGPPYELISGQRRLLAHRKLGEKTIKAVFAGKMNRTAVVLRSLVENMQRVELDFADTSKAITELYEKFGRDEDKVVEETGLSLRKVRDYIQIEALASEKIKKLLRTGKVSPVDVKRALRAAQNEIKRAERYVDLIIQFQPSVHQRKRLVEYGTKMKGASPEEVLTEAMKPHVEKNLIVSLTETAREGLQKATKKMKMEAEELTAKVLEDWLKTQGFTR